MDGAESTKQSEKLDGLHRLDVRGVTCPTTLLLVLKEVNRLKGPLRDGTVRLELLLDSHDSTVTLPEVLGNMGYSITFGRVEDGYRIEVGAYS